jgi:hypothetical protein
MHRNEFDIWRDFCALHAALLAETGLPEAIRLNEHRFRDLLREGSAKSADGPLLLASLTNSRWSALEQFARAFFHEFESYAPLDLFPAFRRELERRGSGFLA